MPPPDAVPAAGAARAFHYAKPEADFRWRKAGVLHLFGAGSLWNTYIRTALSRVDVRVLERAIVGGNSAFLMAERGQIELYLVGEQVEFPRPGWVAKLCHFTLFDTA